MKSWWLYAVCWFCSTADGYEDLVVTTSHGIVHGYVHVSRNGQNYYVFAGIPFAKPPIGRLRFMPPQPVQPWKGVKEVKEHGPKCPQTNILLKTPVEGEEDCLYLSVYSKKLDGKAPVVVHIHGGFWVQGDGPRTTGPQFLMDSDVVVVDFNYRLGILGFLSFEDSLLPGNMGLKDQVMALKWVKENIKRFGGDPDQVTLVGECTGADAVYHHMVSPLSAGLFHRGIAESGSSYTITGLMPPGLAKERAMKLAELTGCNGDPRDIITCLQKIDALVLTSKITSFIEWQIDPIITFGPVLEPPSPDAFLVGPVSEWSPPTVPLLAGITSGEGLMRTIFFTRDFDYLTLNGDGFDRLMPTTLMIKYTSTEPDKVLSKAREYYLPDHTISKDSFNNLTDMIGDCWFSYSILEAARFSQADVFMYYFDYVGDVTRSQFFGNKKGIKGAFHSDGALYLWQMSNVPPFKGRDYEISRDLVKMMSNFIMKGNPTPDNELGLTWSKYIPGENYLAIRESGYTMENGLLTDRYNFWKSLNFRDKFL